MTMEPTTKAELRRGDFRFNVEIRTATGRTITVETPNLGPRIGAYLTAILTQVSGQGDLACCPGCGLIADHHTCCMFVTGGYPCNRNGCKNSVVPQKGVERSAWFYCGPECADEDIPRRLRSLRKEHTPPHEWCADDIEASTHRGPGSVPV